MEASVSKEEGREGTGFEQRRGRGGKRKQRGKREGRRKERLRMAWRQRTNCLPIRSSPLIFFSYPKINHDVKMSKFFLTFSMTDVAFIKFPLCLLTVPNLQ